MPSLNVSLPDHLRNWVSQKVDQGHYSSASDYLRDLIRSDIRSQEDGLQWLSDRLRPLLDTPEGQFTQSGADTVKTRARCKFGIKE